MVFRAREILRALAHHCLRVGRDRATGLAGETMIKAYNLDLSQRRADNMKMYLVQALGIDPSHIDARGRGSTNFVVTPRPIAPNAGQAEFDAEIAREQPNRRVVVVVETNER